MAVFLIYSCSPIIINFVLHLIGYNKDNDQEFKKKFLIIFGLVMWFMIACRYYGNGSGDSEIYYYNWRSISNIDFSNLFSYVNFEPGYMISVWALSHIFPNPQFCFVFSGLFFSISVCLFIYRNSENPVMSALVFNCLELFIFMVQGLRQSIAMCICLFAIEKIKKRQILPFILLIALAMSFHASAVVFVVAYFLYGKELNGKSIVLYGIGSFVAIYFLPYLFSFVNLFVREKYNYNSAMDDGTGSVPIFINLSILALAFLMRPRENDDARSSEYSFFFYMVFITMLMLILRNNVSGIIERISFFFAFGQMAIIPMVINQFPIKRDRYIVAFVVSVLCIGVIVHKAGYTSLVPYRFFWEI